MEPNAVNHDDLAVSDTIVTPHRLTLYKALCGRWPGAATAELAQALEDIPGTPNTCNTCLNRLERARERKRGWDPTWMRKRPDLAWHVLIRNYQDADPALLPRDAMTGPGAHPGRPA